MVSSSFRIIEHIVPSQHIREYPRATATEQEETLSLSVKQYIPIDNPNPQRGDVTIIGAHANGFPKELYEPLWEEIKIRAEKEGFRIRGIWVADVAHQGHSGVLNENVLGNDPSWMDHPRDLLHFINLKREEMPRPIFGIGHSMGGHHLTNLSLMHPRLMTSLILLDPVISKLGTARQNNTVPVTTTASTYRRDIWPSRKVAAETLRKNKFYQTWDPRVLELWINYGLRELPTAIHPLENSSVGSPEGGRPVTLTTTRHQEVFTFSRPNFQEYTKNNTPTNRITHPDLDPKVTASYPIYRPEVQIVSAFLPHLRPSTFYIFAENSDLSSAESMQDKLANTGVGVGGSGGVAEGKVKSVVLKDVGHLIPMEAVNETAGLCANWIGTEMKRWRTDEENFRAEWGRKSPIEKMTVDDEWKAHVKPLMRNGNKKPTEAKL